GLNIAGLGPNSRPANADQEIATAVKLHAKLVRAELPWSLLEPTAAGQLDPHALAYVDRLMSDAAAHGIGVIALVDSSPCWASSAPAAVRRKCVPTRTSRAFGYPPAHPEDFAAFARTLVERYGDAIAAFEVWNEPDQANERYFAGPNKPARYAALLAAAYPAIKQADPNVKVLGGSLVGSNGVFLKLLYQAGIKGHYDGLAVHFYTLSLAALRATRAVQLANGDSAPIWLDEFGWPDCYPHRKIDEEQACVTASVQAHNLTNVYRALATTSYVAAATMYDMQDSGGDSFGVLTARGRKRPSYAALAGVLSSPIGPLGRVSLSLRTSGNHVVASGSGPVGDFMRMEAFQGGVLRYRAVFTLDRLNRFKLALPGVLGTHGLRVRVYQQWSGAARAAQRSI
ncbi:MAG TPA: cellulase family glycosylhydrolase, partial [Solirubrobacteraceae bacterium]